MNFEDTMKRLEEITQELESFASGTQTGSGGRGGMITKLLAAKVASASGVYTKIVNGKIPSIIRKVFDDLIIIV